MTFAPQSLAEMHAAHLARRQRLNLDHEVPGARARVAAALIEIGTLKAELDTKDAALAKSRKAEHAARARIASLSRVVSELHLAVSRSDEKDANRPMEIVREVTEKHGCTVFQIFSRQRSANVVGARQEIYYRLVTETLMSLVRVGKFMRRDHTTVLHGVRTHAARNGLPDISPCHGVKAKRYAR